MADGERPKKTGFVRSHGTGKWIRNYDETGRAWQGGFTFERDRIGRDGTGRAGPFREILTGCFCETVRFSREKSHGTGQDGTADF